MACASQVELVVKNLPASSGDIRHVASVPGSEDPLEEGLVIHSSILTWRMPCTEEPGGLYSSWGFKESNMIEVTAHACNEPMV